MAVKLDGVMETLLITLYIRAKDAASAAPVLNDQKAAEMAAEIDYDFSKFDSGIMSYYGVLARAKMMDDQARAFIRRHPQCTVVSVGCGLDTRFSRVDNGKIMWYNLDFPEVIEQIGLINFTDEMRHLLPGVKKLLVPLMYITNNRLGMYAYKKNP